MDTRDEGNGWLWFDQGEHVALWMTRVGGEWFQRGGSELDLGKWNIPLGFHLLPHDSTSFQLFSTSFPLEERWGARALPLKVENRAYFFSEVEVEFEAARGCRLKGREGG
jgi:hypothetical protein